MCGLVLSAQDGAWVQPVGSNFITLADYSNDATIQARCEEEDAPQTLTTISDIKVAQGWNAVVWTVTETRWPEEWHRTEVASVGGGEDIPWVMQFRGRIGMNLEPNEESSAVVAEIMPGSPAEQAGLLPGDVIVEVDGQDVRGQRPLFLIRGEPDTTVTLGVMREGEPEPIQFEVTRGRQ
jgi:predicted metalloprotease with PDZ domain